MQISGRCREHSEIFSENLRAILEKVTPTQKALEKVFDKITPSGTISMDMVEKIVTGIVELYATSGNLICIWGQAKWEVCECTDGKCGWVKKSVGPEEIVCEYLKDPSFASEVNKAIDQWVKSVRPSTE